MLTDVEVQIATYLEAVLRQRGLSDAAQTLHGVLDGEFERRARLAGPSVGLRTAS